MTIHWIVSKALVLLCLLAFSAPSSSDDNWTIGSSDYLSGIEPQREGNTWFIDEGVTWFIDENVSFSMECQSSQITKDLYMFLYENQTSECVLQSSLSSETGYYLIYYPLPHFPGENLLLAEEVYEYRSYYHLYLFSEERCKKIGTMMLLDEQDWPFLSRNISYQADDEVILITFTEDAYYDNGYIFGEDAQKVKMDSYEYYFLTGELRVILCEDPDGS